MIGLSRLAPTRFGIRAAAHDVGSLEAILGQLVAISLYAGGSDATMAEAGKRSPITDRPLRHAGQSLEEEFRELVNDKILPYIVMALMYVLFAGFEWFRYLANDKPHPYIFTAVAAASVAWGGWQIYSTHEKRRSLRQGIDGERAVGQFLERLRGQGYDVFHDVKGPSFNVDHVLIGPAGVLTIETKTWSKPGRGEARIAFDGEQITVGGMPPDRSPIIQAKAEASWLRGVLAESTGRQFEVRPVVLFPGWFIEQAPGSTKSVWVLEPKALPTFLDREPKKLAASDQKLASFHLSRFVRSAERARFH